MLQESKWKMKHRITEHAMNCPRCSFCVAMGNNFVFCHLDTVSLSLSLSLSDCTRDMDIGNIASQFW